MKTTRLLFENLNTMSLSESFTRVRYVDLMTEEPLTGLLLNEVTYLLDKIDFSKKPQRNNVVKLIVYLHCLGYSDKQISSGFEKMLIFMSFKAVEKTRHRALQKINEFVGKDIGFITLMYETFKNFEWLG